MTISGSVLARCKECDCIFSWYLDSRPFIDAEIIGTCDNCFNKQSHICIDEFCEDEDGCFCKSGEKQFHNQQAAKGDSTSELGSQSSSRLEISKSPAHADNKEKEG